MKNCLLTIMIWVLFSVIVQAANYEGYGALTQGAKDDPDGWEVYHVTRLDDIIYTPGCLRYAVFREAGQTKGQYIVFDVAGTITLGTEYRLKAPHSYLTIDGSSAPSPGITVDCCIREVSGVPYASLGFNIEPTDHGGSAGPAHDIIVNNLRFLGPGAGFSKDILGINAADESVHNVIYSHCTIHAAGDGIFDIGGDVSDVTISWNLITDTVNASAVSGDAGSVQRLSMHHNVWAKNSERQPKIKSQSTYVDLVNNVCYGWSWIEGSGKGLQLEPCDDPATVEDPDSFPAVNVIGNCYHWVENHGVDYWGLKRTNSKKELCIGRIYFEDNEFPDAEDEDYNTSAKLVIPEEFQVTTYGVGTLGNTVVPYVGTHYPTRAEQDLLNEISKAIGGQGLPGQPPEPPISPQALPEKTELHCYNNVINPLKGEEIAIQVELAAQSHVEVVIYDVKGTKIKTILDEEKPADFHVFSWDGKDASGNIVGSGIYMVHMEAGDYKTTKKVGLIK